MMISDQQARAVAEHLRSASAQPAQHDTPEVSEDVIHRAIERAADAPDLRADRVADAMERLEHGGVDPHEIAEKIICRVMSDTLV